MVAASQIYSPRHDRVIHSSEPELIQGAPLLEPGERDEEGLRNQYHHHSPNRGFTDDDDEEEDEKVSNGVEEVEYWENFNQISGINSDSHHHHQYFQHAETCRSLCDEKDLFPKEKRKTVIAFVFMACGFLVNATSIALTHDRVPDREKVSPLPDAFLDNFTQVPDLMCVPDILLMVSLMMCFSVVVLHPYRWILARRAFFIIGVLYLMRSVTMYVTVMPVANRTVYCSPKSNSTSLSMLAGRVLELSLGGGMQISGKKKSCGDYIYSGHTAMMVTTMLIVREYSPSKFWLLHWISALITWSGMGFLLLAHGHYTIDVIIGYYASTRMFWTYHMLANNVQLKSAVDTNYYGQAWWFRIFQYLEANVGAPLPRLRPNNLRLPGPPTIRFRK